MRDLRDVGQTQPISPTASADEAAAGLADGSSVRERAFINSLRQVGTINADLLVQFDVQVLPEGMAPYRAYTQQAVSQQEIGTVTPGMDVQVAVLCDDPESIWVDVGTAGSAW